MGETNTTPLSVADAEAIKKALLAAVSTGAPSFCAGGLSDTAKTLTSVFSELDTACDIQRRSGASPGGNIPAPGSFEWLVRRVARKPLPSEPDAPMTASEREALAAVLAGVPAPLTPAQQQIVQAMAGLVFAAHGGVNHAKTASEAEAAQRHLISILSAAVRKSGVLDSLFPDTGAAGG